MTRPSIVLPLALLTLAAAAPCVAHGQATSATPAGSAATRGVAVLSAEGARRAMEAAVAEARRQGWAVSIAIVDPAGELLAFARLDGASPGSVEISQAKARTSARLRRATKVFHDGLAAGGTAVLSLPGIVAIEGGVPIVVAGETVGAIGVSGVTSAQDGVVAQAGAAAAAR